MSLGYDVDRLKRLSWGLFAGSSQSPATEATFVDYTTSKTSPIGSATANVMLLSCDLHFQAEKLGTAAEHAG